MSLYLHSANFINIYADRVFVTKVLQARLALLLEISRTRKGSGYLLDAGLLPAVRDSRLCQADPDLGFGKKDIQNTALTRIR